ncbi:ATP-binding protein [Longimicrobium sp.]|uniref:ATP-binding protein n=1 Tax=Longimicrobium sp. TaxID=2029185 RepID=UPI002B5B3123|nr:ATP-binding protein [Longimicrobium sp.]HSU17634.1 ATP-binding protein [Longimicrobium sp.]
MNKVVGSGLHPALRAFPGAVVELAPDGVVMASNGWLERELERTLADRPLAGVLDAASRAKLEEMLRRRPGPGEQPTLWELILEGRDSLHPHAFFPVWEGEGADERMWLVECPADPRFTAVHDELAAVNSEQVGTQRQLAKEKARLGRALDELERELGENSRLSRTLQAQNEEMEAQNEELLAMTEELHAGQEQLMTVNHQLERRTRELQLALSARNRFYAAMSHELRTPINAVMGYNDLLLASVYGPLNEQQELAIERSQRAAQHLRELVNDVLDISRIESGRMDVQAERLELREVVEELFVALRPVADAMQSPLQLRVEGAGVVTTDGRRLRQVLLNLISNALKFGAGSPVWVRVRPSSEGGVEVEVTDGGPGIAPEDLGRIFDEFVQLARDENGDSTGIDGTGLGLPIAQQLARLLGGRIDVSSTVGVGSTFRLTLPAVPPRAGA